ncbi:MAG: hypothetical protein KC549_11325, partial [Myxococcales bacterium]|nr:hypothetical protein [Myxococcales bacterium]
GGEGGMGGMPGPCGDVATLEPAFEAVGDDAWRMEAEVLPGDGAAVGSCAGNGAEVAIPFVAEAAGVYTFSTHDAPTAFDTVLYVRTTCDDAEAELACNDDLGSLRSGLFVELEADQLVYVFVDAFGGGVGPFGLTALRADAHAPPTLEGGVALDGAGQINLRVRGSDPNGDVTSLIIEILVDGQMPFEQPVDLRRPVFGQRDFTAVANPFPGVEGGLSVRVRAVDSQGNESAPIEVPIAPQPEVVEGEACDPDGVDNRCDPDTFCVVDGDAGVCREPSAPEIVDGMFWSDGADLTGVIEGRDATRDTFFARAQLLSADGPIEGAVGQLFPIQDVFGQAEFTALIREGGLLPPEAVGIRVWLVDDRGLESEPADFEFEDLPQDDDGAACDPLRIRDRCADESACLAGICVAQVAPAIDTAEAFFNAANGGLGIRVTGRDANRDAALVQLRLLDADGTDLLADGDGNPAVIGFQELDLDGDQFDGRFSGFLPLDFPAFVTAEVTVIDAFGLSSDAVDADLRMPAAIELGDACDLASAFDICPDGSACTADEADPDASCRVATPPAIVEATAYYNADVFGLGFRVEGTDAEDNVVGFRLELLDADGALVPVGPDGGSVDVQFDTVEQAMGAFSATFVGFLPGDFPPFTQARISALDATGLASEPVVLPIMDPPVIEEGAACDFLQVLARCDDGLLCIDAPDGGAPVCAAPAAECPADWQTGVLNDHPADGGTFSVDGDTSDALILEGGSCGGGAGQDVWAFTAPAAGAWTMRTVIADNADTVLYVRSFCGLPQTELACNDDAGSLASAVTVELEAGETVYIFVDGFAFFDAWRGPYTLVVEPAPQP